MSRVPSESDREATRRRPEERPVMFQSWRNLLFVHWRVPAEVVAARLPAGLHVDTFDGDAWIGWVPFEMRSIRPAGLPAIPWISNFLEMNVRTYAYDDDGVPGVWFDTLEANRWLAVAIARWRFQLPYHWSSMRSRAVESGSTHYTSRRILGADRRETRVRYDIERDPATGDPSHLRRAKAGTLEWFLLERYVLFAHDARANRIRRGRVYHAPYPFRGASIEDADPFVLELVGLDRPSTAPDHVAYSPGVDVEVYPLER